MSVSTLIRRASFPLIYALLFCLFSPAQADLPLILKHTVELPRDLSCWDVQYWMNDSLPGWAAIRQDTVFFRKSECEPECTSLLPQTPSENPIHNKKLNLIRLATSPDSACVAVSFELETYDEVLWQKWWDSYIYNLESRSIQEIRFLYTSYHELLDYRPPGFAWVNDFCIYPPLPACSHGMVYSVTDSNLWEGIHDFSGFTVNNHVYLNVLNLPERTTVCTSAGRLTPFSGSDSSLFVAGYGIYRDFWEDDGESAYTERQTSCTIIGNQVASQCTLCVNGRPCDPRNIAAQTDFDGTRRVVSATNIAFDPMTWQVLWQGPPTPDDVVNVYAVRTPESRDERILFWYPRQHRFAVHSAQDGSFLYWTTTIPGSPYILKCQNRPDEIATFIPQNAITPPQVQIYSFGNPSVSGLTITYLPASTNAIRLRWIAFDVATAYRIMWSRNMEFDWTYSLLATVPATQTFYDIYDLTESPCFFYVTALYDTAR